MAKSKVGELDKVAQYVKNKLPQTGFFSTLDELIADAPFEKAPLDQWKNYLKPGRTLEREGVRFPLKQEELDYSFPESEFSSGFPASFHGQSLTKNQLRDMVREKRPDFRVGVGLDEVPANRFPEEYQLGFGEQRDFPISNPPKYRDWAHPSGAYEESYLRSPDFGSHPTHFGSDVISHSRTTTQPTVDEKLMRLIEEIQSDRHQDAAEKVLNQEQSDLLTDLGRGTVDPNLSIPPDIDLSGLGPLSRRGYRTPEDQKNLDELNKALAVIKDSIAFARTSGRSNEPTLRKLGAERSDLEEKINSLRRKAPDAPFKGPADYSLFELRNQLLNASKQGQDYLGLIRGADVSKRFSHGPDETAGTAFTYDKVYQSQLEKLARQYGADVRDVPTKLEESLDFATPSMRDLNVETISDYVDRSRDLIQEAGGDTGDIETGFETLGDLINDMADLDPARAAGARRTLEALKSDPSARQGDLLWGKLRDDLEDLHHRYRGDVRSAAGPATNKTFKSIVLTPEIREKILKAGVPIWSAAGLATGLQNLGANEDPQGFAKGGDASIKWMDKNKYPDAETARMAKLMNAGLASQWYGIDEEGNLKPFGGLSLLDLFPGLNIKRELRNIDRRRKGQKVPMIGAPGILDEVRSMVIGTDKAREAEERLALLKSKINEQLGVSEPHGFHEQMANAVGIMGGQPPIPVGGAAKGVSEVAPAVARTLAERLGQLGKKVVEPAAEWFFPTVKPTPGNYLTGTAFGGGLGALGDYLDDNAREDREIENFLSSWNANHPPEEEKLAEGGKVEGTAPLTQMLDLLKERMQQLGSSPLGSISRSNSPEPVMKAIGGRIHAAKGGKISAVKKLLSKESDRSGDPELIENLKSLFEQLGDNVDSLFHRYFLGDGNVPQIDHAIESDEALGDLIHETLEPHFMEVHQRETNPRLYAAKLEALRRGIEDADSPERLKFSLMLGDKLEAGNPDFFVSPPPRPRKK